MPGGKKRILAGDPDFEPFFTLPDAEEDGDDDGGSGAFEARLMADLRQALTGFGILLRMLEHGDRPDPDHMDKAFKGDARVVLAEGGPRITDRDLAAVAVAAEQLMAAQIYRFKKVAEMMMARGRSLEEWQWVKKTTLHYRDSLEGWPVCEPCLSFCCAILLRLASCLAPTGSRSRLVRIPLGPRAS